MGATIGVAVVYLIICDSRRSLTEELPGIPFVFQNYIDYTLYTKAMGFLIELSLQAFLQVSF